MVRTGTGINLVTGHHRSFDQFEENIIGHFHKTMSHNVKKRGEKGNTT